MYPKSFHMFQDLLPNQRRADLFTMNNSTGSIYYPEHTLIPSRYFLCDIHVGILFIGCLLCRRHKESVIREDEQKAIFFPPLKFGAKQNKKMWTAGSWGGKCCSSEAFLESNAPKLINICAPQAGAKWGWWLFSARFLTLQHQPWQRGASHSPLLQRPPDLGQCGVTQHM